MACLLPRITKVLICGNLRASAYNCFSALMCQAPAGPQSPRSGQSHGYSRHGYSRQTGDSEQRPALPTRLWGTTNPDTTGGVSSSRQRNREGKLIRVRNNFTHRDSCKYYLFYKTRQSIGLLMGCNTDWMKYVFSHNLQANI